MTFCPLRKPGIGIVFFESRDLSNRQKAAADIGEGAITILLGVTNV